jgi:hypothetical protein
MLVVSRAVAGPDDDAAALKRHGDELLSQKSFVEALDAYERSYARSPNPALHYNRGRALQFLARYPEALDAFEKFEAEAPAELKARAPGLAELMTELRSKVATLHVLCAVRGARVLVAGREVGVTPLASPIRINAGRVSFEVLADGYSPFQKQIDAQGGRTTEVDVSLVSRVTTGVVAVRSRLSGTMITIDQDSVGLAPAEATVSAGPHAIVASHAGFDDARTQVVLRAGERRDVVLDPIRRTPITARWWFWTIVGVAVTGAVTSVLVYAFTTERAATDVGTIAPFVVRF